MNLILQLSQENLPLARAEAESLAGKKGKLIEGLLFIDADEKTLEILKQRISYTHKIYHLLFESAENKLQDTISKFNWNKIYKKDFKLELHDYNCKSKYSARELADFVWRRLKEESIDPKANFENPTTRIDFLFTPKKVFATILLHEVSKDFLLRKPQLKAEQHPTSLNPKVARAMINLTGIRNESGNAKGNAKNAKGKGKGNRNVATLYDPFCGAGGIMIEAAFMGFNTCGYDISQYMISKAEKNFESYKISKKKYSLELADATRIKHKMRYVATDLPYGKNSKKSAEIDTLYLEFLKNLKRIKTKSAVVGFPDFADYKKIIKKAGFKIDSEFTIYLHKSLSKKIVVVK